MFEHNRSHFNCMGYALGIEEWLCPDSNIHTEKDFFEEMEGLGARHVENIEDVEKDEYLLLFRASKGDIVDYMEIYRRDSFFGPPFFFDFHWLFRAKNGRYYHKIGSKYEIDVMTKEEAFQPWKRPDGEAYEGKIYMFATRNKRIDLKKVA